MQRSLIFARYVTIGVLAVVTISACTSGSPKPNLSTVVGSSSSSGSVVSSPSASPSPSLTVPPVPADVPRTGHNVKPGEQPPTYPVAALARTQAGANAFAKFFMQTWDWAYATTDTAYMAHFVGATCGMCSGVISGIRKTDAEGHAYEGGRFTIGSVEATTVAPVTAPADFCSNVAISATAQTVVDGHGNIVTGEPAHSDVPFKICLKAHQATWAVTYWSRVA